MELKELSEKGRTYNKAIVASTPELVEPTERYDPGLNSPKKVGMTIFIVIFGFPEVIVQCSDRYLCFCKLIEDFEFTTSSFTKNPLPEYKLMYFPHGL